MREASATSERRGEVVWQPRKRRPRSAHGGRLGTSTVGRALQRCAGGPYGLMRGLVEQPHARSAAPALPTGGSRSKCQRRMHEAAKQRNLHPKVCPGTKEHRSRARSRSTRRSIRKGDAPDQCASPARGERLLPTSGSKVLCSLNYRLRGLRHADATLHQEPMHSTSGLRRRTKSLRVGLQYLMSTTSPRGGT